MWAQQAYLQVYSNSVRMGSANPDTVSMAVAGAVLEICGNNTGFTHRSLSLNEHVIDWLGYCKYGLCTFVYTKPVSTFQHTWSLSLMSLTTAMDTLGPDT